MGVFGGGWGGLVEVWGVLGWFGVFQWTPTVATCISYLHVRSRARVCVHVGEYAQLAKILTVPFFLRSPQLILQSLFEFPMEACTACDFAEGFVSFAHPSGSTHGPIYPVT